MASINATTSSGIVATADNTGQLQLQSAGTTKFTIDSTGAYGQIQSGTAQASTSGTSIDFTGIPSWVKQVTVMFNAVSTNGSSIPMVQLGASSVDATSYSAMAGSINTANNTTRGNTNSTGFTISGSNTAAADTHSGFITFSLFGSNIWTCSGNVYNPNGPNVSSISGLKTLSGTLDRVRITTVNGTDAFDAGSINILYE
jgi:hypothetical protein